MSEDMGPCSACIEGRGAVGLRHRLPRRFVMFALCRECAQMVSDGLADLKSGTMGSTVEVERV